MAGGRIAGILALSLVAGAAGAQDLPGFAGGVSPLTPGYALPSPTAPAYRLEPDLVPQRGVVGVPDLAQVPPPAAVSGVRGDGPTILPQRDVVVIQVASFPSREAAGAAAAELTEAGFPARRATLREGARETPIVIAGPYGDPADAEAVLGQLAEAGYAEAFIRN